MTKEQSAEIWKDIKGYEGLYQISSLGRVKSYPRKYYSYWRKTYINYNEKILKPLIRSKNKNNNYFYCDLYINKKSKHYNIHRLIAIAFIPNPDNKPCINHIDGNKQNNNISNLEWCTIEENNKHALNNGLILREEKHPMHKLNNKQVIEIRNMKDVFSTKEISKIYNVTKDTINNILSRKNWKYL